MLRDDRNNTNLDRRWFTNPGTEPLGYARVGKMNGTNFEEKASIQCEKGGAYVSDIPIASFSSTNGGNLAIQYVRNDVNNGNANVYWRYAFGGEDGKPQYNTENNNDGIDANTKGKLILKFKNPPECVVVHIWLYKVQKKKP